MRELKFRAWDTGAKRWASGVMPVLTGLSLELKPAHSGIIIEQYTGLKDKNGKEIYDGDIVLVANHGRTPYVAIYREGDCCFVANNEFLKDYVHLFKGLNQCYEVIGNIHENPELLDVKKEG